MTGRRGRRRARGQPIMRFVEAKPKPTTKPTTKPEPKPKPDCRALLSDEALLARAIIRHLCRYPSIGSLRLVIDLVGRCVEPNEVAGTFFRVFLPVLLLLERMGYVELVRDDPVIAVSVVNLADRSRCGGGAHGGAQQ